MARARSSKHAYSLSFFYTRNVYHPAFLIGLHSRAIASFFYLAEYGQHEHSGDRLPNREEYNFCHGGHELKHALNPTMMARTAELHALIYELVVSFGSRVGSGFPVGHVLRGIEKAGYSDSEFLAATDALRASGLLTEDDCISESFFNVLGPD